MLPILTSFGIPLALPMREGLEGPEPDYEGAISQAPHSILWLSLPFSTVFIVYYIFL